MPNAKLWLILLVKYLHGYVVGFVFPNFSGLPSKGGD